MHPEDLQKLLQEVAAGTVQPQAAFHRLAELPFQDLGFAKIDHHRQLRQGLPEVIFGLGKTVEEQVVLAQQVFARGQNLLITRTTAEVFSALSATLPQARFAERARIIRAEQRSPDSVPGILGVVAAGTSDLPVAEEAVECAQAFGIECQRFYDVGVAGLHRLLAQIRDLEKASVLIVVAGMEGALASVVGGLFKVPVIAVPTSVGYGASLGGIAALLAMLNSCAAGVVVCNVDNGFGAANAAYRMLANLTPPDKGIEPARPGT